MFEARERERERESVCVCVRERKSERERERERVCVCVRERVCVKERGVCEGERERWEGCELLKSRSATNFLDEEKKPR